jgi:hypothetical protein
VTGSSSCTVSGTVIHNIKEINIKAPDGLANLTLDPTQSQLSQSLSADAKAGFYVPLYEFIRSWANIAAARKEDGEKKSKSQQQFDSFININKEGMNVTSNKQTFSSWSSVAEAYLMMMLISCEGNLERLTDYALFLTQMTAQVCKSEWPVVLYYIEKIRANCLPKKPLDGGDTSSTQEMRANHKLFREIDRAELIEIYHRIVTQPRAVAERLRMDLSSLCNAMPSARAAMGVHGSLGFNTFEGGETQGGLGTNSNSSSSSSSSRYHGSQPLPSSVYNWCKENALCMSFQTGRCIKSSCPFKHVMAPAEILSQLDRKERVSSQLDKKESFIGKDKSL